MTDIERLAREYKSARSFANRLGEIDRPRSRRAGRAFSLVAECVGPTISIGGGPLRAHPRFVNLNLAPFPNVDVVGDAQCLPFGAATIGALHCEAVLEHVERPDRVVAEMFRVLRLRSDEAHVLASTTFVLARKPCLEAAGHGVAVDCALRLAAELRSAPETSV